MSDMRALGAVPSSPQLQASRSAPSLAFAPLGAAPSSSFAPIGAPGYGHGKGHGKGHQSMPQHPAPHPSNFAASAGQAKSGSGFSTPKSLHLPTFTPLFSHASMHGGATPTAPEMASQQFPVVLHIYHLSDKKRIRFANHLLRVFGSGAYHAAVEVHGIEWSFGSKQAGTGVFACEPTACSAHTYKKPYLMGYTKFTEQQTEALIEEMAVEWQGRTYDLLTHNCTHFSRELCRRLGVGPMPSWVTSLAAAGAKLDEVRDTGHKAKEKKAQQRDISRGSSSSSSGDDYRVGDYS